MFSKHKSIRNLRVQIIFLKGVDLFSLGTILLNIKKSLKGVQQENKLTCIYMIIIFISIIEFIFKLRPYKVKSWIGCIHTIKC